MTKGKCSKTGYGKAVICPNFKMVIKSNNRFENAGLTVKTWEEEKFTHNFKLEFTLNIIQASTSDRPNKLVSISTPHTNRRYAVAGHGQNRA
jgi:hypothetical protein